MFNRYKKFDNPCSKDCSSRTLGCHSVCMKYLAWKIEHEAQLKERAKDKQLNADMYIFNNKHDAMRRNEVYRKSKRRK